MLDEAVSDRGLWVRRGGFGERMLVLLHGMGANGAVWGPLARILDSGWPGRVLIPDLRGHGRSVHEGPYGVGTHAADIAALVAEERAHFVALVGHSFGGVIAALAASAPFDLSPRAVVAIGVKIRWTEDEIDRARELARRPARNFATREEAIDRYLRVSGLAGMVDPSSEVAATGIAGAPGEWRLAMDPRVYEAIGPSVAAILKSCTAPLHLAAGENDPMVKLEDMRAIDPAAVIFAGHGHNVHWEAPELVWEFIRAIGPL